MSKACCYSCLHHLSSKNKQQHRVQSQLAKQLPCQQMPAATSSCHQDPRPVSSLICPMRSSITAVTLRWLTSSHHSLPHCA